VCDWIGLRPSTPPDQSDHTQRLGVREVARDADEPKTLKLMPTRFGSLAGARGRAGHGGAGAELGAVLGGGGVGGGARYVSRV